jgi:hypothetical protein
MEAAANSTAAARGRIERYTISLLLPVKLSPVPEPRMSRKIVEVS